MMGAQEQAQATIDKLAAAQNSSVEEAEPVEVEEAVEAKGVAEEATDAAEEPEDEAEAES